MHQMPGDVWWRTWRTLPPKQCPTDPDYSSQGQWPVAGVLADLHRPAVGQEVQRLGGPLHLPRDLADVRADLRRRHVRGPDGQPRRARDNLGHAQLRASTTCAGPRSRRSTRRRSCTIRSGACRPPARRTTPGTTAASASRDSRFRRRGLGRCEACIHLRDRGYRQPARVGDRAAGHCPSRPTRTSRPCAAGIRASTAPTAASTTRSTRPPARSAIGELVLDQSMIMASLDDALNHDALQRYFARDPVSWAAHLYLSIEPMSIAS